MVSVASLVGFLVIVAVHTLVATVAARYFRVRMKTQWGAAVFALVATPLVLIVSTLVLSGVLGLGGDLGDRSTVLFVVVLLPLTLGYSIDLFWLPSPEEVDLPDTQRDRR
ncbi:hypothetical protein G9464_04625 [Halostella sp. JP-L12]|uniref:hypothetical protein n=1 Tax=Halostella TaxID=1843185 RepID=UPI000EF83330|nr:MULTISPECIES: hypothetical protein [Halostella]NHN46880.1 hypothetical protein [Halostella sp. JP-L12]